MEGGQNCREICGSALHLAVRAHQSNGYAALAEGQNGEDAMGDTKNATADSQWVDEEVELTADDLRALSAGSNGDVQKDPAAASAASKEAAQKQADSGERGVSRLTLPLSVAIALMAAAAGLHQSFKESSVDHPSTVSATALAAQEEWPTASREANAVRFANPFDASEVFEFPAGTTEAEAREAVAGFLVERAKTRQARLDSKLKINR
jgi:hypothetical protein